MKIIEKYSEFSRGIDYLTVRIPRSSIVWSAIFELQEGEPYELMGFPFVIWWKKDCVNSKAFRTLRILDRDGNRLGQIKIVKEKGLQQIFDEIELQGAFWMAYGDYINIGELLAIFDVDIHTCHGLSRIDYRFDLKVSSKKVWSSNFYPSQKEIRKRQIRGVTTWMMSSTDRVTTCAYDKKLDIFDNLDKKNLVNVFGENPYTKYVECESDITRVEYRKNSRALRETKRTIVEEMAYSENDAIEYIRENFNILLEVRDQKKYRKSENEILLETLEYEKTKRALEMVIAYTKTLDTYGKHKNLVGFLYDRYGLDIVRELHDYHFKTINTFEHVQQSVSGVSSGGEYNQLYI